MTEVNDVNDDDSTNGILGNSVEGESQSNIEETGEGVSVEEGSPNGAKTDSINQHGEDSEFQSEVSRQDSMEEQEFLANSIRQIDRTKLSSLRSRLSVQITEPKFNQSIKKQEILRTPEIMSQATVNLSSLSPHKTPSEYGCPQFEVEKFNPRTKIKMFKKTRLFEVNLAEKRFSNLTRNEYVEKSTFTFDDVESIEISDPREGQYVIGITVKGKKLPRRLIFPSKSQMWRFHELCKLAITDNVVWIPEIFTEESVEFRRQVKKIQLEGEISVKRNVKGEVITEQKTLGYLRKGQHFLAGSQYDELLVYCVTWNLGVCSLPDEILEKFVEKSIRFGDEAGNRMDMYVICIQQILNPQTGAIQKKKNFGNCFDKTFKDQGYVKLTSELTQGVGLFVFVREAIRKKIPTKDKIHCKKKFFKGLLTSVTLQFSYNDSTLAFCGVSVLPQEFEKKSQALLHLFDPNDRDSILGGCVEDTAHHIFLLGDFNTTVALPPSIALSFINKREDLGRVVIGFDQLKIFQQKHGKLQFFKEGNIDFLPTYPVKYHTYETLAAAEKSQGAGIKSKLNYQYIDGLDLSYSSRVLIRSFQGISSEVKEYGSCDVISGRYRHLPVYSVISVNTQRHHVSHFEAPSPRKVLKFMGIYVGGICTISEMKDPQLRIEGDWFQSAKTSVSTKRKKGRPTSNPKFMRKEIPIIKPVKDGKSFLSSVFLRLVLYDKSLPKSHCVKGTAVLDLKSLIDESVEGKRVNGTWFICPIVRGTATIGDLIGYIAMIERKEGEEEEMDEEVEGEFDDDETDEIKDIVKGFEG